MQNIVPRIELRQIQRHPNEDQLPKQRFELQLAIQKQQYEYQIEMQKERFELQLEMQRQGISFIEIKSKYK